VLTMERTKPVNPARRTNLLLKILLYPQVSAFKILKAIPSVSNFRKNYHDSSFSVVVIISAEFFLFNYFDPHPGEFVFARFLFIILCFHGFLAIFFDKKISEMAFDYYAYYNKVLLYIFLVFMLIGFFGIGYGFYSEIGHLPK